MRCGREKRLELKLLSAQHAGYDLAVCVREVEHTQLAFHMGDVLDDLVRLFLAQGELVAAGVKGADHVHKSVDGKRVVLAGDSEAGHGLGVALEALFKQVRLLEHLPGVAEEGLPLGGGHHALARPLKHRDAHFALQVAHGGGHAWLRYKEPACGLRDAAACGDLDDISELLEFHLVSVLSWGRFAGEGCPIVAGTRSIALRQLSR